MFAIVAIPKSDDYVWNLSSEKIPHMTLLAFEDPNWTPEQGVRVAEYLEHAASFFHPFGLGVEYRGELGDKKADVLFFDKDWAIGRVQEFRSNLLANPDINAAVRSDDNQFDNWVPHLTMGFPDKPARPDKRDYPGTSWVQFDQVALWVENYSGPTYRLKPQDTDMEVAAMAEDYASNILKHYGVKGMKWGVRRRSKQTSPNSADATRVGALKSTVKTQKTTGHLSNAELRDAIERMRLEVEFSRLSGGLEKTKAQKGKAFAAKILSDAGKQTVSEVTKTQLKVRVDEQIKKAAA